MQTNACFTLILILELFCPRQNEDQIYKVLFDTTYSYGILIYDPKWGLF